MAYNAGVVGGVGRPAGGTFAPYRVLTRIGAQKARGDGFPHHWGYGIGLKFFIRLSDEPFQKSVESGVEMG